MRKSHTNNLLHLSLILWISFIWIHSALPASASSEESRVVGNIIRPFLELIVGKGNVTGFLIRKLAHFIEYMILGFLMNANVAAITARIRSQNVLPRLALFFFWSYGLLLSVGIAVIDEGIQILSPGRSPQVADVLLDAIGSFSGMILSLLIFILSKRKS